MQEFLSAWLQLPPKWSRFITFSKNGRWAKKGGINRLELIVVSSNEPAIKLFQKCDFEMEGLKKNSLKVGGQFFYEYIMAKILN